MYTLIESHPIENPATARWDVPLKHAEYTKLLKGFQPQSLDDKYMIRADTPDAHGNTTIRFYRSWIRHELVALDIVAGNPNETETNDWARITKITWETRHDPGWYLSTETKAKEFAKYFYTSLTLRREENENDAEYVEAPRPREEI